MWTLLAQSGWSQPSGRCRPCSSVTRSHQMAFRSAVGSAYIARSNSVTDAKLAAVKRRIDHLNQRRNDWIEELNERFMEELKAIGTEPKADARLNTETVGSVIDRLSILSQRLRSLQNLASHSSPETAIPAKRMLDRCQWQRQTLENSLTELLVDILEGRRIHYSFRNMKLYNDRRFNRFIK